MKILKRLVCLAVAASAALSLIACTDDTPPAQKAEAIFFHDNVDFKTDPYAFIAHAGGTVEGYQYTNALEAVENSLAHGYKLIEIDLSETSDGHLVGVDRKSTRLNSSHV